MKLATKLIIMARRNAKENKYLAKESETDLQSVQSGTGNAEATDIEENTSGKASEGHTEPEGLSGQSTEANDSDGSSKTSRESTGLDAESESQATGTEGSKTEGDKLGGSDDPDGVYQEAKEVITGMVDEALAESGILDEPKEKTEMRNKIAQDVFLKNAAKKTLHFTSDMIPFFEKSDAKRHADTLKDDTVVTINKK